MMSPKFDFPKTVFIIGLGGTGAEILRRLRHYIPELYREGYLKQNTEVVIVDHDIVESKNVFRQDFYPWDIGLYKVEALFNRYRDFINLTPIPEALNRDSLPLIFTKERLSKDFMVISTVDHKLTASQIYFWLRQNAPISEDICWSYLLVGGDYKEGTLGNIPEVESYYVSSFLWGFFKGVPLSPYEPHKLTTILKNPGDLLGRRSDGTYGCGVEEPTAITQTSVMNYEAANNLMLHIEYLYQKGISIYMINSENGERKLASPKRLEI